MTIEKALGFIERDIEGFAKFSKNKSLIRKKVEAFNVLEIYLADKEIECMELAMGMKIFQKKIDNLIGLLISQGHTYLGICLAVDNNFTFNEIANTALKLKGDKFIKSTNLKNKMIRDKITSGICQ